MNDQNPLSPPHRDRDGARKKAQNHFAVREERDSAIKQEINRERAANDAKTEKLRALRLAKEETDREVARLAAVGAPPPKPKKPRKKFVMG
ncbi:MAG: hypothetical protein ACXWLK_11645 [Rhizomicrobium sp.]|jgi:hypothetical protein